MVEITPEIQEQLDEQKKNCPFCKIINGEIEAEKVYNDNHVLGILDINPCANGHILFLPKEHYPILPYLPQDQFKHLFSLMPQLIGATKKAMISTGANIFVANGAVAGQQSPHFLIHLIPRENGDGVDEYSLNKTQTLDEEKTKQAYEMLAHNIPLMMAKNAPADKGKRASFLSVEQVIYEDSKVVCSIPEQPQCLGHLVIYSNEEEHDFENLSKESSFHLFTLASLCATAVFEGLGAHGSNIILKTGHSDDNPDGKLAVHILPRFPEDGIDVQCKPKENKPDLKETASRLKDELFIVEHGLKKTEKTVITIKEPEVIKEKESEVDSAIKRLHG